MNMWNREAVPLEKGDLWGTVNCNCFQLSRNDERMSICMNFEF